MKIHEIIILGIIQGLTEFMPISSSGHLILVQNIMKINQTEILLNVSLHVGTLGAVIIVFWKKISLILNTLKNLPTLIKQHGNLKQLYDNNETVHTIILLLFSSTTTIIFGLILKKIVTIFFEATNLIAIMLIITGTILWLTKKNFPKKNILKIQIKDSLIIGALQGISILPGVSRSGITIAAGLFLGMNREYAGHFSFLLSIPTIIGALTLSLCHPTFQTDIPINLISIGILTSLIVGYTALQFMLFIIKTQRLYVFTPYCYIRNNYFNKYLIILKI